MNYFCYHYAKPRFLFFQIPGSKKLRNASFPSRPEVVKIGSILTFDSTIGKIGKIALEAAVEDVNSDPTVLNGTKLELTIHDSNSSGFVGIMEGMSSKHLLMYFLHYCFGF